MTDPLRIRMYGPALDATSGISAVVNNWISAGLASRVELDYVSTLDEYVPGHYLRKLRDAARASVRALFSSRHSTDLAHIHVSSGMSFYRKLVIFSICRLRGVPAVVHLHGSEFETFQRSGTGIRRRLIRWLFEKSAVVLALSKTWKDFVFRAAPAAEVEILYNGAPASQYTGGKPSAQGKIVLFMGRLGDRKGTGDLLRAFSKVAEHHRDARLVLGGDGEIDRFRKLADDLGVSAKVEFRGWIGPQDKVRTFLECDIYALPSYNEGLPGSIVEAMAAGKPVISTPVGGIPEAVREGENGFLVDPGDIDALSDRLDKLLSDEGKRSSMGEKSRQLLRARFDSEAIVGRLVSIYENCSPVRGTRTVEP